jgi:alpha-1,6-mannosyltransferase
VRRAAETGRTASSSPATARVLGTFGLLVVLVSVFGVVAGAAGGPSLFVPARSGGWPGWLAGPLAGLQLSLTPNSFQTLTLAMTGGYLLVLLCTRALPLWALALTIVLAHVIVLLGPPLISQDVFGYIGYAHLGALHGLNPYTSLPAQMPTDSVYGFLGWPYQHSPYGPLFTLLTYAFTPLGLAGELWALKALAVLSSLGAVALVALAAGRMGRSRRAAAAFVGLNPVLLELAIAGAHNDTLALMLLALALALTATFAPRNPDSPRAAHPSPPYKGAIGSLVAAIGVKASAGLVLPYLVLAPERGRERLRLVGVTALWLAALAVLGAIGFGTHTFGFLSALNEQQQLIAVHSIPAETARLVGLTGTPGWWRNVFLGLFGAVLLLTLWRTARGHDWRTQAGWATLALLIATAWLLPWYAIWALPLAALSASRRLRAATLVLCLYALLIHLPLANPLLSPPRHHAPERVKTAKLEDLEHVHQVHAGGGDG